MDYTVMHRQSVLFPVEFWEQEARKIDWFEFPQKIHSKDSYELDRWFEGGKLNTSYLALDRHVEAGRGSQPALIWDSPVTENQKVYTYTELRDAVALFAGGLRNLGVELGDRIIIYMPMVPEAIVAMLACARIGAVHSVVFGGFAAHELAIRINDARPKLILCASGGKEIQKIIPYKPIVDAAIQEAYFKPDHCVVLQRDFVSCEMKEEYDVDWHELLAAATPSPYVPVDAWHPLYILYTSGTTGQPKGIVRDNGGHAVALNSSMEYVYNVQAGDVYWAASDIGWVVGHSYIVYGPLIRGCTTILYEGKPIKTPDAANFWRLMEKYKVNVFFTAPTAIRAIRKEDPEGEGVKGRDLSALKYLFLAGERTDVATYEWVSNLLQKPVIDHWWQTESGWPMLANMAGVGLIPIKPGSPTRPVFGFDIRILDAFGHEVANGEEGAVAIQLPLPPGCLPGLWNDNERFIKSYLSDYPGFYTSGDGGYKDDQGYFFITGRIDDVINVAGHRLSTSEMEEVLAGHTAVAECAVVGCNDELKGQVPIGFVVLKHANDANEETIALELMQRIRDTIGALASLKKVYFLERLPKTRSGKILRKIIRCIVDDVAFQPPSTIEDITVLDEIRWTVGRGGN
ncbi:MAG: acetate--CoA ligase [Saprospiraceae bacterium]|nr:acetate--CoA ligase [Saprospiraceae bacterium]MBK9686263.1 acetate--CoA ligase [Saprospiraceae bacterium]MBL0084701.1 acetate--CoA ligase [Saprospiraceae bacterium]